MPKVRQYEPNQVSTQITQTPTLSVDTRNGNRQVAQALGNAAQGFIEARNKVEISRAEDAFNQYNRDVNTLKFNPDNGYFNTEGINAVDGADGFNKELTRLKEQYSQGLQSQISKDAFTRSADTLFNRTQTQVMRHASRGQKVYEQSVLSSRVENAKENMALNWNDEKEVSLYRQVGRDAIIDKSESEGLSPEATAEEIQSFESEAATAIIESAVTSSSEEAKQAMGKYGDLLEGNLKAKLQKRIDIKIKAEREQSKATETIVRADAIVANAESQSDILDAAKKIKDPEMRDKVKSKALKEWKLLKDAEHEERLNLFDEVSKFKNDGGSIESFIASNPDEWEKLSAKQQKQLITGSEDNPDMVAFTNFMSMPDSEIKKMSNDDIENVMAVFPKNLRDDISRKVVSARKGNSKGFNVPSMVSQSNKIAVEKLFGEGVLSSRKSNSDTDKKLRANQFLRFVNDEYLFRKSQKGDELTPAEYDDLLSDMTRQVVIGQGLIFDDEENLSELTPESTNRNAGLLRDIGIEVNADTLFETDSIVKELEKRNIPITSANIQKMLEF